MPAIKRSRSAKKVQINKTSTRQKLLVILFALIVASVGAYLAIFSHAAATVFENSYVKVSPLNVSQVLSRRSPNIDLMQADHSGYTEGLLYNAGFAVKSRSAGGFQVKYTTPTQGVGFYEGSGGMVAGQTAKIHTYINPNKPNGTYKGSIILQYYAQDKQQWVDGPTVTYTIRLVDTYYTDYLTAAPRNVNVVLSRKQIDKNSQLIYSSGFTVSNKAADAVELKYEQPTQGQGFDVSSSGLLIPQTLNVRTYINPNKSNGTYSGSAILQYHDPVSQKWLDGPRINYSIKLVDSYYTDEMSVAPLQVDTVLSRAKTDKATGLIYGTGLTITSKTAGGVEFKYTSPTQGQGFETSSSGMVPGQTIKNRTYINPNKPNGVYTGSVIVEYYDTQTQTWLDGPTIPYTITLVP